ncbi:hypothetical protein [Streptomyces aidingensis]|uniref:Uncharacterized protein n=1 Tax=Streptomyces aidingensis TaxID=910347 RepID=A0A1I1PWI8_9ACTN|nr:hypothetical protein [Streptomyces aidingensis]SFD14032.1 hypothetical protein SAMN05421773_11090 [Streptomyces aidingensis]
MGLTVLFRDPDRRAARRFAKTAKIGTTYYYAATVHLYPPFGDMRLLDTIVFDRRHILDGTPSRGAFSAESYWLTCGPLYANRNDPAIRNLKTIKEWEAEAAARSDAYARSGALDRDLAKQLAAYRTNRDKALATAAH